VRSPPPEERNEVNTQGTVPGTYPADPRRADVSPRASRHDRAAKPGVPGLHGTMRMLHRVLLIE
jgi:hypothetical protein